MGKIAQIQGILGVAADDAWGPKSQAALDALVRPPSGDWSFLHTMVDGDDLLVLDTVVTAFGGLSDTVDGVFKGETASGFNTAKNPNFMGCALPMRRDASLALRGSPIPKVPWHTRVVFTDPVSGQRAECELIDEGPARSKRKGGDLMIAAAKIFDPKATVNNFERRLNIRIVGGAKYLGSHGA